MNKSPTKKKGDKFKKLTKFHNQVQSISDYSTYRKAQFIPTQYAHSVKYTVRAVLL